MASEYLDEDSGSTGPLSYENWKGAEIHKKPLGGGETPCFTDAWITGELREGFGPYCVLNTVAQVFPESRAPSIVLRYWWHINHAPPDMSKTDVDRYHAGGLADELAALVSLALGIRLHAGGENRRFAPDGDPLGDPFHIEAIYSREILRGSGRLKLPRCVGPHNLNESCNIIATLPILPKRAANALIRAARMYQEAVWIGEASPSSSWLLFVSALESAANYWRASVEAPMERLEASRPKLVDLLREKGDDTWVQSVAAELAPYMGSTKKFTDFVLKFLPQPPDRRAKHGLHSWEGKALQNSLRTIYRWRSNALHSGTPFPAPMCEPPREIDGLFTEKPIGLASATQGGVWTAEDAPMLLHLFEHITRGVLINWWSSVAKSVTIKK